MKFFNNFSLNLKKLIYNRRFTVPFSLILAFTLWLIIVIEQKPIITRTFSDITVNVNLENTFAAENDMNIIGDISEQKFTVTVMGPSYAVSGLTSADLSLFASAGEVDAPGEYNLKVAATGDINAAEYDIITISPPTLKVNFDYVETKEFTVVAAAEGVAAADGLVAENAVLSGAESDTVTISGPRTVINQIESVKASAKINKTLSASETFEANIALFDADGKEISTENLTLSMVKVNVTVPISKKKTVPVVADFTKTPSGFDTKSLSVTIDHDTVTVIGTPDMVDKTKSVTLSAIDITTVSESSNKFDVSAKLPEGVRILESIDHFRVTVNTKEYVVKSFNVPTIRYKGLSSKLKVDGPRIIANVKVCGLASVVNDLSASDIYAVVDLTNKTAGVYTVDAAIEFKDHKNIWAQGTYTTSVTVK